ncbi:MAG: outer membrane beta-barrel protein [Rhizobiales bacterium]|nr:outer membrane beta-barrel protein [Hyphomicrobiales bacterium]
MGKHFVVASAAVAGVAIIQISDANAQDSRDALRRLARQDSAYSWGGFYLGAEVGGSWQKIDYSGGFLGSTSPSALSGGGYAGFNYNFRSGLVLGIEGKFGATNVDSTVINGVALNTTTDWYGTLGGRAGYAISPNVLAYITGGGAWTNQNFNFPMRSESTTRSGYFVGGGIEGRLCNGWTARVEYTHSDYGRSTNFGDLYTGLTADAIRVGVSTNFGKPGAPVEYVKVCSLYGAGFFYIPGTDTAVRVGSR